MERQSQVMVVRLEQDGSPHEASYFVERDVIHANIDGQVRTIPLGNGPAAETVKSVLSGYLLQKSRKLKHLHHWHNA
jgi:hypothetical protein